MQSNLVNRRDEGARIVGQPAANLRVFANYCSVLFARRTRSDKASVKYAEWIFFRRR